MWCHWPLDQLVPLQNICADFKKFQAFPIKNTVQDFNPFLIIIPNLKAVGLTEVLTNC